MIAVHDRKLRNLIYSPVYSCGLTMITLYRLRFLSTSFGFNHAHKCISDAQRLNIVLQSCFAPERATSSYNKDVKHWNAVKGHLNLKSFSTVTLNRLCWNCGSSAALFFCSSCNAIQPADDKTNYFDILNMWVNLWFSLYIFVIVMNASLMESLLLILCLGSEL